MAVGTVGAAAADIRTDFMKLLVTQLQNQDPMAPMDNNQMATQLAQLSSLEQLENMNGTFREVLAVQERLEAMGLIGKEVEYMTAESQTPVTGTVEAVKVYDEGVFVVINGSEVDPAAVTGVRQ